ncbi:peptidylprolyl isomerase [Prevotella fusca]|uniref:Peptidyl-prolyl cis-trans isomerase n=1 Tax=Prevotella fusca JCM 17724 TaxID=1236517 RepID=A0A0K1NNQ9_9BACT|nr:peptidylprolyl isomerase [Prevotella fusca]AKU70680.1 peptidylprolyl isomerase [Prevotella fusca JCM 17724]QUB85633.1 peptidylprolyl isomerase [Prevotella fusca JCM 17724]
MKKILYSLFLALIAANIQAQTQIDTLRHEVLLETDSGNIRIQLYNETPLHRDNFLRLVRSGAYDGVLFHRVIKDFMIQTGDMGSKTAKPGQALGDTPESYSLPAEIHYPELLHRRGAVAAAREGDDVNPKRESSASQFYIVWGIRFSDGQLDWAQERLNAHTDSTVQMTPEVRRIYKEVGGTPHLDGQYTVFGQVLEGMDVVEHIQQQPVDANDRPLTDVHVRKASVLK